MFAANCVLPVSSGQVYVVPAMHPGFGPAFMSAPMVAPQVVMPSFFPQHVAFVTSPFGAPLSPASMMLPTSIDTGAANDVAAQRASGKTPTISPRQSSIHENRPSDESLRKEFSGDFTGPGIAYVCGKPKQRENLSHVNSLENYTPNLSAFPSALSTVSVADSIGMTSTSPDDPLGLFANFGSKDSRAITPPPTNEAAWGVKNESSESDDPRSAAHETTTWYHVGGGLVPKPFLVVAPPRTGHQHERQYHPMSGVQLRLRLYQCPSCTKPRDVKFSKLSRPPDLKLGGVCGDLASTDVYHIISALTTIPIEAIEMFGKNLGRCNIWLSNKDDVNAICNDLAKRIWMAPLCHGYAVIVDDARSKEYLMAYLESLKNHGPQRVRFPRHLMTIEPWNP